MGQSVGRAFSVTDWVFPLVSPSYDANHKYLIHIPSEAGIDVPAMLIAPSVPAHELGSLVTMCVIYFHANACDIGQCIEDLTTFRDGALEGDAAMLCPEYPGYGLLRDYEPSVVSIDTVADSAWRYCVEDLCFEPEQIVLWGRSIGTGTATALAHRVAARSAGRAAEEEAQNEAALAVEEMGRLAELRQARQHESRSRPSRQGPGGREAGGELPPGLVAADPLRRTAHPVGALVLLAPFTSVSAVVEHHLASRWVASVVGPMWNVLELVQDRVMEDVPLCVVHPKCDEVVPSRQGLTVYEQASSREKFGIWLCHASHNLYLLPEHLAITKRFLAKVTIPAKIRARSRWPKEAPAAKPASSELEDLDAREFAEVAEQLMHLGATRRIEEGMTLSL
mmetsp:Transcript_52050/g.151235  ORF Transcript_52050/g.151235 Transcript_52050/m.151235 type:complete len:394 (-) Transcript_52050:82-1263(-)